MGLNQAWLLCLQLISQGCARVGHRSASLGHCYHILVYRAVPVWVTAITFWFTGLCQSGSLLSHLFLVYRAVPVWVNAVILVYRSACLGHCHHIMAYRFACLSHCYNMLIYWSACLGHYCNILVYRSASVDCCGKNG